MSRGNETRNGSWPKARLGDVCELNPRRLPVLRDDDAPTTFLPMPAVGESGAGIQRLEKRPYRELRKGYTSFVEGDVLFAKITPCMQNGKHAIARGLTDGVGFGSTEFHVLRPGGEIISEWIHYFLLQPSLLADATRHFTGAVGQQRVPEDYLATLEIPVPPLDEQRRIAARLREQLSILAEARAALETQLKAADTLPAGNLRAVFESEEAQSWPLRRLGDLLSPRQEIVHPRNKPVGAARFVGLEHIEPHTGRRIGELSVQMEQLTGRKARFFSGDIVYGYLRPYLNKVWIADFDGLCSVDQYVFEVRRDLVETNFVVWFLRSSTYLSRAPIGQTPAWLPRIRTEEVAAVQINLPPLDVQREIADRLEAEFLASRALCKSIHEKLSELEKLPAALLRSAFSRNDD